MFALFHPQCSSGQSDHIPGHSKQGIRFLRHQVENVGELDKPSNWVTGERSPTAALV